MHTGSPQNMRVECVAVPIRELQTVKRPTEKCGVRKCELPFREPRTANCKTRNAKVPLSEPRTANCETRNAKVPLSEPRSAEVRTAVPRTANCQLRNAKRESTSRPLYFSNSEVNLYCCLLLFFPIDVISETRIAGREGVYHKHRSVIRGGQGSIRRISKTVLPTVIYVYELMCACLRHFRSTVGAVYAEIPRLACGTTYANSVP